MKKRFICSGTTHHLEHVDKDTCLDCALTEHERLRHGLQFPDSILELGLGNARRHPRYRPDGLLAQSLLRQDHASSIPHP